MTLDLGPVATEDSARAIYDLHAISLHTGGPEKGHYISVVRRDAGLWYRIDDAYPSLLSEGEVSRLGVSDRQVYLLFYVRGS